MEGGALHQRKQICLQYINVLRYNVLSDYHKKKSPDDVPAIQEVDCSSDECAPNCAPGWEEFNGRCYFWSQEKLFWGAAELKCQSLGGHLASVTSNDTHDFLYKHVSEH